MLVDSSSALDKHIVIYDLTRVKPNKVDLNAFDSQKTMEMVKGCFAPGPEEPAGPSRPVPPDRRLPP